MDTENPLLEVNDVQSKTGEIWLKGNFVLLNLNLSRKNLEEIIILKNNNYLFFISGNYLTTESVKEFLLSIQQQSTLTSFQDVFNLSSTATSPVTFLGLCRLELKVKFIFVPEL